MMSMLGPSLAGGLMAGSAVAGGSLTQSFGVQKGKTGHGAADVRYRRVLARVAG
jgi:hypothetical protein